MSMMVSGFHPLTLPRGVGTPSRSSVCAMRLLPHAVHIEREHPAHDRRLALIDLAVGESAITSHVLIAVAAAPGGGAGLESLEQAILYALADLLALDLGA